MRSIRLRACATVIRRFSSGCPSRWPRRSKADAAAFDAAVALLANPDVRVFCGGGRYTAPLASLFSFTLAYARPHVQYVEPNVNLASVALADMGPGDVLVIFDFRRYQRDVFGSRRPRIGSALACC